jgi:hypothetical protein
VHRDLGLTRAKTVTVGLAGVTLVGVVAVAALARHDTDSGTPTTTSNSSDTTDSNTNSSSNSSSTDDGSAKTFPNLGGHSDPGGAAATSGGS